MNESELRLNLNLSPALTLCIENELADHIACADEAAESTPFSTDISNTAGEIKERLSLAFTLRKLSSPHIVDQVSYTLCRKPTRAEWKEFGWLLFWFILVYASDLIAVSRYFNMQWDYQFVKHPVNANLVNDTALAWLVSAVARAGFFMQFALTFLRAFGKGIGVLIARLIQLKLIHTLLVTFGFVFLTPAWDERWEKRLLWEWKGGSILNMWSVASLLIICITLIVLVLAYRYKLKKQTSVAEIYNGKRPVASCDKAIVLLSFMSLVLIFLYQGAPVKANDTQYDFISKSPSREGQRFTHNIVSFDALPLSAFTQFAKSEKWLQKNKELVSRTRLDAWWSMPFTKSGAGLGWLAFPIPLMGLLSLLAMWWVLGKRSVLDTVLYGIIAISAFFGTVGPFMLGAFGIPLAPMNEFFWLTRPVFRRCVLWHCRNVHCGLKILSASNTHK